MCIVSPVECLVILVEKATKVNSERNLGFKAGDRLSINGESSGNSSVLTRRDFVGEFNLLRDGKRAFLKRTFQVNLLNLLTEVKSLSEQANVTISDIDINISAIGNCAMEGTSCLNSQVSALLGWVGGNVDVVNSQELWNMVITKQNRAFTWNGLGLDGGIFAG